MEPAERRFVMYPALDAVEEQLNDAIDLKVDLTDPRLTDERTPLNDSVTSAKIVNGAIVDADVNASAAIAYTKVTRPPLSNASDVAIDAGTLAGGQVIKYNAATTNWVNGAAAGGVTASATAPNLATAAAGDAWFDTNDGTLYVCYVDVDSTKQWVQVQANSALEGSILARLGALEGQSIAYGNMSPNYIINGGFDIWQRGTAAISSTINRSYFADRWAIQQGASGGTFTAQQSTDVPSGAGVAYSGLITSTVADTSIAATDQYYVTHIIEGAQCRDLNLGTSSAKTFTVSFWVKSSVTGTFCFSLRNDGATRSYVSEYTISVSDTWEKKSITVAGDTTGTWLVNAGIGLRLEFVLAVGSDRVTATPNSWTATGSQGTSNQTNFMSATGRTFRVAAVQLEVGSVATSFRRNAPSIQGELAACQRYYFRKNTDGSAFAQMGMGQADATTSAAIYITLPVQMRTAPTAVDLSAVSTFSMNNGVVVTTLAGTGGLLVNRTTTTVGALYLGVAGGLTALSTYTLTANNTTAAYIGFTAEL